jgi:hypothetical protein
MSKMRRGDQEISYLQPGMETSLKTLEGFSEGLQAGPLLYANIYLERRVYEEIRLDKRTHPI